VLLFENPRWGRPGPRAPPRARRVARV